MERTPDSWEGSSPLRSPAFPLPLLSDPLCWGAFTASLQSHGEGDEVVWEQPCVAGRPWQRHLVPGRCHTDLGHIPALWPPHCDLAQFLPSVRFLIHSVG